MSPSPASHTTSEHDEALERAAQHIERTLQRLAYAVDRQVFSVRGSEVRNIEATREPKDAPAAGTLIVGAHYNSFEDSPGANDNATGTAAVLELARLLEKWQPRQTRLRFVLFVNEEPPYFRTADMGSWRYAKRLSERGEQVRGMICARDDRRFFRHARLTTLPAAVRPGVSVDGQFRGLCRHARRAQVPARGDRRLPQARAVSLDRRGGARHRAGHRLVRPLGIPPVRLCGHHDHGYGALPLSRTIICPSDTPDKVDYDKLARITKGLERVVRDIAP